MVFDFFPFQNMDEKATYFARKFEAIVSTQVINSVDAWLYGHYPKGKAKYVSPF